MRTVIFALTAAAGLVAVNPAQAGPIFGGPTTPNESGLGSFTGSIVVTPNGDDAAILTITITNTSPLANGGFITAIAFNNPDDVITGAVLDPDPPAAPGENFGLDFDPNDVNGAPFGQFDFVLSTGGSFNGGGPPANGLAVGETGVFVIDITGVGADELTQEDFENAFSVPPGDGQGVQFLVVRFRGFEDDGSDKVAANVGTGAVVPEPASVALGLCGAAGLAGVRRLRRRAG
jgi:hypothetical protein